MILRPHVPVLPVQSVAMCSVVTVVRVLTLAHVSRVVTRWPVDLTPVCPTCLPWPPEPGGAQLTPAVSPSESSANHVQVAGNTLIIQGWQS